MQTGILKKWNHDKGYGFIKPDSGSGDIFVHISSIRAGGMADPPPEGAKVDYDVEQGEKGPRATKVMLSP